MKRVYSMLLAALLLLSLTGCGSNAHSETAEAAAGVETAEAYAGDYGAEVYEEDTVDGQSLEETPETPTAGANDQTKLVYTAQVTVEAQDFDGAAQSVEQLVSSCGGYFEQKSVEQGSYGSTYRSASYTIRVPSDQYRGFLDKISATENCHVVSSNESTQDIGEEYYDTESRLTTLKTKLERLQTLLAEAKKMEDIITLESAISDTEYQIDQYDSTLNHYDSLVNYSTINLSLEQVTNLTANNEQSLGQRMSSAFAEGVERFQSGAETLVVWLAGHIIGIAVLIVLLVICLIVSRRVRKRMEKRGRMPRRGAVPPTAVTPEEPQKPEE